MANAPLPAMQAPRMARRTRSPEHTFYIKSYPWAIQPFLIAPVLPGETLKNMMFESRVITDPIKNPIMGWWHEQYYFYVKLRDLDDREAYTEMLIDQGYNTAPLVAAGASVDYNQPANSIPWAQRCHKRVVEEYFRNEDETWLQAVQGNMPAASIGRETFLNSAVLDDNVVNVDFNVDADASGSITASEMERAQRQWEMLTQHNLTHLSYEDYLRTFGLRVQAAEEDHKPELLKYKREWTYPTNTIDPANGTPRSACSWAIRERLDKNFLFREPGFIFGVMVTRPKVYFQNVDGSGVSGMDSALKWLPAVLRNDVRAGMQKYAENRGPLQTVVADSGGYWFDVKDLLLYGDDFLNIARNTAGINGVALPDALLSNKRYPANADRAGLFVGATSDFQTIRADGIVRMDIATTIGETTPVGAQAII